MSKKSRKRAARLNEAKVEAISRMADALVEMATALGGCKPVQDHRVVINGVPIVPSQRPEVQPGEAVKFNAAVPIADGAIHPPSPMPKAELLRRINEQVKATHQRVVQELAAASEPVAESPAGDNPGYEVSP